MSDCDLGANMTPERCRQYRLSFSASCRECLTPIFNNTVEVKEMAPRLKCDVDGCEMFRAKGPYCYRHHKNIDASVVAKGVKPAPVVKAKAPVESKTVAATELPKNWGKLQCPLHKCFYPLGEDCPECRAVLASDTSDNPLDKLMKRKIPGLVLDLSVYPGLADKLTFHGIDNKRIVELLGWLVAGELEHHPYKSRVAP